MLQFATQLLVRKFIYEAPIDSGVVVGLLTAMIFTALVITLMHILFNKMGLLFVDSEILRTGNDQLLNDLEEGVIILKEDSKKVLFVNKAASKLLIDINMTKEVEDRSQVCIDMTSPKFAKIDENTFKRMNVDV